jgi:hypothetical protein
MRGRLSKTLENGRQNLENPMIGIGIEICDLYSPSSFESLPRAVPPEFPRRGGVSADARKRARGAF